jgi:methionyl-tRNA synthetase
MAAMQPPIPHALSPHADAAGGVAGAPAYYVTTPIYYVNDRPHIGHCYTTLLADAVARFARAIRPGHGGVFLLTGTDEHADKVVTSAAEHHTTPDEWAARNAEQFRAAFAEMNISNDDFIRTTEPRHKERVSRYIAALMRAGDIYKGDYTGWYDEGQEEYVTETAAREHDFKSPINKRPLVKRTEPCYFFRLGAFQDRLRDLIGNDTFCVAPEARKNEVLGRLKPPAVLNDVPISRPVTSDPATQWGIRVPGDEAHRVYVWIDALFNYLTVVDTPERRRFWPCDVHLIGKDILWFHAVIWPALLMALRKSGPDYAWVELPARVFGHGWWVSEGQKMSKTLGNFIGLEQLRAYAQRYGLDALRWYLVTQGPLSGADADFSHAKFVEVYNADLANGIGNCASRVSNMVAKYFDGKIPDPGEPGPVIPGQPESDILARAQHLVQESIALAQQVRIGEAVQCGMRLVGAVDALINATEPFKLAKKLADDPANPARLARILYHCAEGVRSASLLLAPAMPTKMAALWKDWNWSPGDAPLAALVGWSSTQRLRPGTPIIKGEGLFMRADTAEAAPTPSIA